MFKSVVSLFRRKKEVVETRPAPTKRQLCQEWLHSLDPELFKQYRVGLGLATPILAFYPNIDRYTQKLKEAALILRDHQLITPEWVKVQPVQMSLDRFLNSDDGFYQDPVKVVERFRVEALSLCAALEESDNATYGSAEHNLRMLTKLLTNLNDIVIKLVGVSLTSH